MRCWKHEDTRETLLRPQQGKRPDGSGQGQEADGREEEKNMRRNTGNTGSRGWLSGVLLGVLFLGIGAAQGQFAVIWRKAVMICLECIGIG